MQVDVFIYLKNFLVITTFGAYLEFLFLLPLIITWEVINYLEKIRHNKVI